MLSPTGGRFETRKEPTVTPMTGQTSACAEHYTYHKINFSFFDFTGTESAIDLLSRGKKEVNFNTDQVEVANVVDTAQFMMEGVTRGEREIYFPPHINYIVLLREFLFRFNLLNY